MSAHPHFAVVGHPNKGKSSIVATLAHDDSVRIGEQPGTTTRCRSFPMKVDGEVLYTLVDTPGFQRARGRLGLAAGPRDHGRPPPRGGARRSSPSTPAATAFPDECELLAPVMDGAGILYVVDGSVPYGPEYDAEMEILRWTGQPRLALINPIGETDHVEAWRTALGQYFSVVRVFDARDRRLREAHRAAARLRPARGGVAPAAAARGGQPGGRSRAAPRGRRPRRRRRARRDAHPAGGEDHRRARRSRAGEGHAGCRRTSAASWSWNGARGRPSSGSTTTTPSNVAESALAALEEHDLFSAESWRIFGLTRMQLLGLGAMGGAAAGGAIDLAVGGASMLLGTLIGGGVGAAATYLAANRLVDVKLLEIPLGRVKLVAGPTSNRNFPHVVLGRARLHHALVAGRAHAQRGALAVDEQVDALLPALSVADRKRLEKLFGRLRGGREVPVTARQLATLLAAVFARDTAPR